ncbi:D-2-hydroxyacid dehydrogenase family protein [Anianabacter salinae]|uniref:D-2-hydroxyacid dehydrogenase family protein n=1 Tax=Anianabacter salinae TaxID=2851023 RepID=UPI00225E23D7|nr:D-2-hydroxyacid dehydrogenase family protein [Anianabacter salinae]MBV0912546.1 D-2-hydroxyacid dehydrogenase family protein [Anianabacter salinae]
MKIAILDDYADRALGLADWSGLGADITVFHDTLHDAQAVIDRLAPFDVVCLMRERTAFPRRVIEGLPNLKLIVTSGPRNAAIDVAAATVRGIPVSGTRSRKTTTSELAMLMILAINRRLIPETEALRAGGWQAGLGRDLAGLTLGVIGLGNIGAQMAALGRAFGMDVAAWSQNLTEARCAEVGARRMDSLPALMAEADISTVHLVLSARSAGLIGAEAFAAAKPGHVFVNTSRGPIVDQDALVAALHSGALHSAGLDVFDVEPLPDDSPLRDEDLIASGRLLLTPHLGYTTEATFRLFYEETVEAIAAWQSGVPVRLISA